jgi:hypothetical protein
MKGSKVSDILYDYINSFAEEIPLNVPAVATF